MGYAWAPLLKDGRLQSSDLQLPVAANLPAGYLCDKNQDAKRVGSSPQAKDIFSDPMLPELQIAL